MEKFTLASNNSFGKKECTIEMKSFMPAIKRLLWAYANMRCVLFLLLFIGGHSNEIFAQDVTLNFQDKSITLPTNQLKKNDRIIVKVINYNPYLYRVVINNKDSSVAVPIDGSISGFFPSLSNVTGLVTSLISGVDPVPAVSENIVKEWEGIEGVVLNKNLLLEEMSINTEVKKRDKPKQIDSLKIVKEIQGNERLKIEYFLKEVDSLKDAIEYALFEISRKGSVQRQLVPGNNAFTNIGQYTDSVRIKLVPFLERIRVEKGVLQNGLRQYLVMTSDYRDYISKKTSIKGPDSLIIKSYSMLVQHMEQMDSVMNYKKIDALMTEFEIMAQASNAYVSFPIYLLEDAKKIKIAVKPINETGTLPAYETELVLPWVQPRAYGVSAGIYISPLHNEAYTVRTDISANSGGSKDTSYIISEDQNGKGEFGINALAYTAWKVGKKNLPHYLGLSFGGGISIESKPKPRVFLGAAYVHGEKRRVAISVGIAGGFVNRLSSSYKVETEYTAKPDNFVRDVFKTSGFLSVNYSFL